MSTETFNQAKLESIRVAILGAGNVGSALATLFANKNHPVFLGSRQPSAARATLDATLAKKCAAIPPNLDISSYKNALKDADFIILAVPDGVISEVCTSIAKHLSGREVVIHCSGALEASELLAAKKKGCQIASAHPLNTFPSLESALKLLKNTDHGTYLFCEGDELALERTAQLFKNTGFNIQTISKNSKALYHAACVFACNYLTVLMDLSLQTAEAANIDRDIFWRACTPIIQATLRNIAEQGTANALSGPISRGDSTTVKQHLEALSEHSENLRDSYAKLGVHALQLTLGKRDVVSNRDFDKALLETLLSPPRTNHD